MTYGTTALNSSSRQPEPATGHAARTIPNHRRPKAITKATVAALTSTAATQIHCCPSKFAPISAPGSVLIVRSMLLVWTLVSKTIPCA